MDIARKNRIQIAFISAAGFALVVGLYEGVVIKHTPPRTRQLQIAYAFEAIWEAAFFGFGLAFCIIYGYAMRKLERGPVRGRCIGIWIAISYFFMSWWPHASMHQFLTPINPTDFIILEVCFHWTNLAAALVLCWYQLDVLLISYAVAANNKELRGWTLEDENPVPWYKNIKLHGLIIAACAGACWITFGWHFDPYPPFIEQWQKGFFWSIFIVDGSASGISMGFAYVASRLVHRLPKPRTRYIAAVSIGAISFILCVPLPHAVAHFVTALSPTQTIVVEYVFHLAITTAVSVLAFYQHKFLELALKGRMTLMMKFKDAKVESPESFTSDTELRNISINANSGVSTSGVEFSSEEL